MNWHTRLTQAREAKGLKKSAFARLVGVSPPTVTDWENGDTKMIVGANLIKVCAVLDVAPDWLMHGVEDVLEFFPGAQRVAIADSSNSYQIPKVKLRLQAGINGIQTESDGMDGETQGISRSWVSRKGFDPTQLIAIQVKGESMEPTFYEGDTVVINLADKSPHDNAVYAINYGGEAVVKRMSRDAGQWWLMSDNSDQRKFYRRLCNGAECIIIGRIVRREGDHF
ncbi:XRE family transcriptional regulator [Rugamonas sp. DEMB1]|uniref:XRE family transcriptional regulator n=1 Tax=Rugamonas sp. DEMB1 TaxID=3039386 RepID=UPI00244880A1|nr:LexA family transcriptional regulator [Rugamonas sp. DEMB1]WGG48945.1 LexA family transcriptional regulator [Rugamonas sp. DEMB1]